MGTAGRGLAEIESCWRFHREAEENPRGAGWNRRRLVGVPRLRCASLGMTSKKNRFYSTVTLPFHSGGLLFHGDGFRQVAWLVYVASAADGDVIRQQLQRHDFQDRQQELRRDRN